MAYQSSAFYLYCDNTYNLEIVETFLLKLEEKYGFKITVDGRYFSLPEMADLCEKNLPQLLMDFAIFVVHANESRLIINEDNADISYARFYRGLLQKTGGFLMNAHVLPLSLPSIQSQFVNLMSVAVP